MGFTALSWIVATTQCLPMNDTTAPTNDIALMNDTSPMNDTSLNTVTETIVHSIIQDIVQNIVNYTVHDTTANYTINDIIIQGIANDNTTTLLSHSPSSEWETIDEGV
jgi:hypothetical protein